MNEVLEISIQTPKQVFARVKRTVAFVLPRQVFDLALQCFVRRVRPTSVELKRLRRAEDTRRHREPSERHGNAVECL